MPSALFHFGEFEIDCARFELRRNGRVVKLEHIPMELHILLAEVSPPYFTALALWSKGQSWDGGGLFKDDKTACFL